MNAGGSCTPAGPVAGGIGPPATGGVPLTTEDAAAGMPSFRFGGEVRSVCMMPMHGTPGPPISARTGKLNSGAVQKNPAVAMAVVAAQRLVVRDMVPPFRGEV